MAATELGHRHPEARRLRELLRDPSARHDAGSWRSSWKDRDSSTTWSTVVVALERVHARNRTPSPVLRPALLTRAGATGVETRVLKEGVLEKLGTTRTPQPVLVIAAMPPQSSLASIAPGHRRGDCGRPRPRATSGRSCAAWRPPAPPRSSCATASTCGARRSCGPRPVPCSASRSRGAGGVILITTKRGKVGKPIISYDGYYSTTSILEKYKVFNGAEYAQFKQDAATYNRSAYPANVGSSSYVLTQAEKDALAAGISTDWQDLIFQQGYTTSHQLGVQGGTDLTQYSMGAGFFREAGIVTNQKFDRANLRLTLDQKIGKRIKIGITSLNTVGYTNNPGGGGVPGGLVRLTPLRSSLQFRWNFKFNPCCRFY